MLSAAFSTVTHRSYLPCPLFSLVLGFSPALGFFAAARWWRRAPNCRSRLHGVACSSWSQRGSSVQGSAAASSSAATYGCSWLCRSSRSLCLSTSRVSTGSTVAHYTKTAQLLGSIRRIYLHCSEKSKFVVLYI
jgi:hypothetical protein